MTTEADTCRQFVVRKLQGAGWDDAPHAINEQRTFTDGRVLFVGGKPKRGMQKRADYKGDLTMAKNDIEKVRTLFAGISDGNVNLATQYIDQKRFVQHNPYTSDGVEGLRQFIRQSPRDQLHLTAVRAFQDGPYVVTQAKGQRAGKNIFFDIFRFDDGLVVEHWAFSADDAPPNRSGHTQNDGPIEAKHLEDTEKNKSLLGRYYETFHIRGDHSGIEQYFAGDLMIRHEPGVRDGVAEFMRDVEVLMQHRTIDEIKFLLGQGDFVFIAARGTHEGESCAYIDLYRMEDGKLVEHWGFPEKIPPQARSKNNNGML
jgi:predicted SnoaL-like aldol condensation-catalyzing enzyme